MLPKDPVELRTTCFERIFFSKKGTLIKRAGVRTPWTPPGSATGTLVRPTIHYVAVDDIDVVGRSVYLVLLYFLLTN